MATRAAAARAKWRLAALWAGLLALLAVVPPARSETGAGRHPDLALVAQLVIERTNDFRKDSGRAPAPSEARLSETARAFAAFMAGIDRYGHEADGRDPGRRATERGYAYCVVLENIALIGSSEGFSAQELAERLVRGWEESPGHRRNMLDPDVLEQGVGVAQSEATRRYYAVQMLGRPESRHIEFAIANAARIEVEYGLDGRTFSLPPRETRVHTQCRAARLTVRLPGEPQATTVEPADGDRYVIERAGPRYRLRREARG